MTLAISGLARGGDGPDGFGMRVDGVVDFDKDVSSFTIGLPTPAP